MFINFSDFLKKPGASPRRGRERVAFYATGHQSSCDVALEDNYCPPFFFFSSRVAIREKYAFRKCIQRDVGKCGARRQKVGIDATRRLSLRSNYIGEETCASERYCNKTPLNHVPHLRAVRFLSFRTRRAPSGLS